MYILRIEHPVMDYDGWKKAFDSDPANREKSGVLQYRILRPVNNPKYVMIDLEFETKEHAEALLAAMRKVWSNVQGKIIMDPVAMIAESVEVKKY
jgi:ribosomal protein L35AE/L33A